MNRRLYVLAVALVVLSLVVLACGSAAPASSPAASTGATPAVAPAYPKREFSMSTIWAAPPSGPGTASVQWIADELSRRSGGQMTLKVHWSSSIAKPGEEFQAVKSGLVDMAQLVYSYQPSVVPLAQVVSYVPFGPGDGKVMLEIYRALYAQVPGFKQEIEQLNQKYLGLIVLDTYDVISKSPIKTIDDFKGKKIAVTGTGYPKWFEAVGGAPVAMPVGDRYTSMQTGVIEASFLSADMHFSARLQEMAKNYTEINAGARASGAYSINADVWNSLTPAAQKLLQDLFHEAGDKLVELTRAERQSILDKMKAAGVTIHPFAKADRDKWAGMLPDFASQWIKDMEAKGSPGRQVVDIYLKTAEQQGYTYPRKWGTE